MHGIFYTVLIALTNSLDDLGAWMAFSIKGIKISNFHNLWISFIMFIISAGSTFAGGLLPGAVDRGVCAWISMALFSAMGIWCVAEPLLKRRKRKEEGRGIIRILENPEEADLNRSKDIDFREATLLGAVLSINNVGGSFSAGVIGLNPWLIGALSAAVSYGALWVGRRISAFFQRHDLGFAASLFAGVILLLIGLAQVL